MNWKKLKDSDSFAAAFAVACGLAFVFLIVVGAASCDEHACKRLGEETGVETKYDVWSTCYVKIKGRWVPQETWREVEK